jgi:hypothetical protein
MNFHAFGASLTSVRDRRQELVEGLPMADEIMEPTSAADEIAQFWHTPAFDLEGRQHLLARALAAGRPVGMRSWADDSEHDTGHSDALKSLS